MDDPPLASLSLTHVHYNPNDPIAHACAFLALVPQALCITYATLIWSTREAEVALMFAGQLACEALNWVLKRTIREERPHPTRVTYPSTDSASSAGLTGKGYGMPSSHAQFVSYFAVSLTFFLLLRHNPHAPNASTTHIPTSTFERLALSALVIAGAAAVAQSRIYLNYHTERQILVGCIMGALFAVFWYLFTAYLRRSGWLDWVLDTSIAKFFRIRDLVVNEDLVDAGWERWQQRRSKRSEQKSR
ncbi:dolichyldiphosphatase [Aureobasidium sp. EXF-12298]|nr:dolichyldiphosphatase [Aureobasidium sp. EXF-12298]KAI4766086.1 dolichyldiphosphatase [Aureobasidium sp. EXF-12344]KAI4783631.1 dolichyldiphosphatase [Aureobasidium sp. EXF-3400]